MTDDPNEGDGRPEHDIEKEEVAQESEHDRERRERRGELARHPHTQLRALLTDLQSPAAQRSDITTKYGTLHSIVTRLTQLILTATPPPNDSEESINEDYEQQRQHAEGADKQVG